MRDYKKLNKYMKLSDYIVKLRFCDEKIEFNPFEIFSNNKKTLWFTNYNDLKHNRTQNEKLATFQNVLESLAGLSISLYEQFGLFYDIINNDVALLTHIQAGNGVFISQNALPIFEILKYPEWKDDEKYYFDWEGIEEKMIDLLNY